MTQQPPSISKEERALDRARWHANCPIDSCKTESGVEKFIPERCEVSRALLAEAAKVEGLEVENKKLNEKAAILLTCRIKTEDDALAKIADLEKERDAYKKAKSENDDRFQIKCLELEQKLKRWEDEEVDKAVCCWDNQQKAEKFEAENKRLQAEVDEWHRRLGPTVESVYQDLACAKQAAATWKWEFETTKDLLGVEKWDMQKNFEAMARLNDTQLAEINRLRAEVKARASSFKEYWAQRRTKCLVWDQKSEENKHLHTWLYAMSAGLAVRFEKEKL